jgi:lysophospholipase L1-like esterase
VVHLNCGLHDLKRNPDTGAFQVPIAQYQSNVGMILDRVLRTTKAAVVWATITPVNEVWHRRAKDFDRFEGDVRAYNAAALEAVTARGVALDDLYTLVSGADRDGYLSDDGVHFTDEGYTFLGRAVAGAIRRSLSG